MKARKYHLGFLLIAGLFTVTACNDATTQKAENMADSAIAKIDTAISNVKEAMRTNDDSDFVVKAATTNMTEVAVLQAGINKGSNKEVKAHARMMLADHKKLGEKVRSYATKKGYALPDNDNGKADDAISKLDKNTKGKEWDAAWTDHMVSAHEDAISSFEKGDRNVKDEELRSIIQDALPKLRAHLEMMKNLKDKLPK